ncbi:MAG TPA: hypothetical protein EYN67_15215 [Flavobacteriales bacterium]|nr:hypothetical protein [Flavobacteriales bacterium]
MVLSVSDKQEIAALFQAFSERLTTGRQVKTAEEQALEIIAQALAPTVLGPRYVPLEERAVGAVLETAFIPTKRKKAMTKFNRAVKEGMKIVKQSTSYGKKGSISNAKKAFSAVTKTVSKARKGGKLATKGVLRKVGQKAATILKKVGKTEYKPKRRKKLLPPIFDPSQYYRR